MILHIYSSFISTSTKLTLASSVVLGCLAQPALSQRDYDPNINHFYMGRQQWTIEDNSPVIINRTGTAPGAMNGSLPNRAPLPKAGWQGYAPIDNPSPNNNLPKAPGSSKPKAVSHAASKSGRKGQAGNLSPTGINSYKPYSTYSSPANTPNVGTDPSSSTHVKGSLLHWARRSPRSQ